MTSHDPEGQGHGPNMLWPISRKQLHGDAVQQQSLSRQSSVREYGGLSWRQLGLLFLLYLSALSLCMMLPKSKKYQFRCRPSDAFIRAQDGKIQKIPPLMVLTTLPRPPRNQLARGHPGTPHPSTPSTSRRFSAPSAPVPET